MPELEARSLSSDHPATWRRPLPAGSVALSHAVLPADKLPAGTVCWPVEWDEYLSSPHAFLQFTAGRLTVRRRLQPRPTSNLVFRGTEALPDRAADELTLAPGESFRIGDTVFTFHAPAP